MITKNGWNAILSTFIGKPVSLIDINGSNYDVTVSNPFSAIQTLNGGSNYGVRVGTSTSNPTADDLNLESDVTANFNNSSTTSSCIIEDNYAEITATHSLVNKTDSDITITEVGFISSISGSKYILLEHTKLETPITVPAKGTKTMTYTIRFNHPTA